MCGKALLYLEFLVLVLILFIYGVNYLVYDMRFMHTAKLKVFTFLKYSWLCLVFVLLALIVLEWIFFDHKNIMELVLLLLVFSPFLLVAFYNIFKYIRHGVSVKLNMYRSQWLFFNFRISDFYWSQYLVQAQLMKCTERWGSVLTTDMLEIWILMKTMIIIKAYGCLIIVYVKTAYLSTVIQKIKKYIKEV